MVRKQLEFYFSHENLLVDQLLVEEMEQSQWKPPQSSSVSPDEDIKADGASWIDLGFLLRLNRIRQLFNSAGIPLTLAPGGTHVEITSSVPLALEVVRRAVKQSKKLVLCAADEGGAVTHMRRKKPFTYHPGTSHTNNKRVLRVANLPTNEFGNNVEAVKRLFDQPKRKRGKKKSKSSDGGAGGSVGSSGSSSSGGGSGTSSTDEQQQPKINHVVWVKFGELSSSSSASSAPIESSEVIDDASQIWAWVGFSTEKKATLAMKHLNNMQNNYVAVSRYQFQQMEQAARKKQKQLQKDLLAAAAKDGTLTALIEISDAAAAARTYGQLGKSKNTRSWDNWRRDESEEGASTSPRMAPRRARSDSWSRNLVKTDAATVEASRADPRFKPRGHRPQFGRSGVCWIM